MTAATIRPPLATTTTACACPLDCPDACSLEVTLSEGRVIGLDGSEVNPLTGGYICAKVRRFPERVYGPERIQTPLLRRGPKGTGELVPATWDEALGAVAARLVEARDQWGGESILPLSYGGSNGFLTQDTTDARLFWRLGASRLARTVCAAPSTSAAMGLYGKMPGVAFADFEAAQMILVWGCNPSASGIHAVPYIQRAQKNGARLAVVDPRRTPLAARADLHLAVRPGTDLPVALSILRWLFASGRADEAFLAAHATGVEELRRRAEPWSFDRAAAVAGVPTAQIEELAQMYSDASTAVVRCGWGPERNRNGGSAIAAILALPAVAGKFGVRGGGYTLSNSGAWSHLSSASAARAVPPATRLVNMNKVGAVLENGEPPVRVLFVYNANPLMTLPNQQAMLRGLAREDLFTVVFDQVLTDTALFADVVLPATTFLEHRELSRGYGAMVLQRGVPAVPPVGEARPNYDVFAELCRRTGVAEAGDPETADEIEAAILAGGAADLAGRLARDGIAEAPSGFAPVQFGDVMPRTDDGKVHLFPPELDAEAPQGLYSYQPDPGKDQFPLALISPASDRAITSTLFELVRTGVPLLLNPADAAPRGIAEGDPVRVWNDLGEVRCAAAVGEGVRPGVVFLPKGLWSRHTANGRTSNALCPDTLTDLGGGACFNDARVEVERA